MILLQAWYKTSVALPTRARATTPQHHMHANIPHLHLHPPAPCLQAWQKTKEALPRREMQAFTL